MDVEQGMDPSLLRDLTSMAIAGLWDRGWRLRVVVREGESPNVASVWEVRALDIPEGQR
jgi:hypothetical protein